MRDLLIIAMAGGLWIAGVAVFRRVDAAKLRRQKMADVAQKGKRQAILKDNMI